jgi:hypothetical protein
MSETPTCVVDANVLLNLATPVVDGRERAPSGADPLKAVLVAYDVHVPSAVLGELGDASGGDDLLAAAADLVLRGGDHLTAHDVAADDGPLAYGLDSGESAAIRLANDLGAELFVTDEFGSTNYLLVNLALEDRNTLFTTPHLLCGLGAREVLPKAYVDAALTYYVEAKGWDPAYVAALRTRVLTD